MNNLIFRLAEDTVADGVVGQILGWTGVESVVPNVFGCGTLWDRRSYVLHFAEGSDKQALLGKLYELQDSVEHAEDPAAL